MTVQVAEIIRYKGKNKYMQTEPLQQYLEKEGRSFSSFDSSCWRGYYALWEFNNNKLYLVELVNCLFKNKVDLQNMFNQNQEKVFANWYSGDIVIPTGELLEEGLFGIDNVYERNIILKFKNGILISEKEVDNTL